MKEVIPLIILGSIFLSGCQSASFGLNVSIQDVIQKTEPKSNVLLETSPPATFNCIKGALLAKRLRTDYVELGVVKVLWQVGTPSMLDQTSINAAYVVSPNMRMDIYVTKNMFFIKEQLREIGEIFSQTPNWQPPEDYWPRF